MDVSNASLYDGASALAEAVLMAVRANRKSKSGAFSCRARCIPPTARWSHTIVANQDIELVEMLDYDRRGGHSTRRALRRGSRAKISPRWSIPQPNFFGVLEDVDALTDWAHAHGALVDRGGQPDCAWRVLKPPGEWGEAGADIACGEGQPLGVPLSSGGPYFGFMCCTQEHVRQMPGRIVGRTVDLEGKPGFTLTLQAREQHIRRSKATSNICTNQGLVVTAAHHLHGPARRRRAGAGRGGQPRQYRARWSSGSASCRGARRRSNGPVFHEAVLRLDRPAASVLDALAAQGIVGGYDLGQRLPGARRTVCWCAPPRPRPTPTWMPSPARWAR